MLRFATSLIGARVHGTAEPLAQTLAPRRGEKHAMAKRQSWALTHGPDIGPADAPRAGQ